MRQFYKKISSVCMALLCVAALLIGCTATAWAADEIDDSVKSHNQGPDGCDHRNVRG